MGLSYGDAPHALVVPSQCHSHTTAAMLLSEALASLGFNISFVYFSSHYAALSQRKSLLLQGHHSPMGCPNGSPISANSNGVPAHAASANNGGRGRIDVHVLEDGFIPSHHANDLFFETAAMKDNLYCLIAKLQEQMFPPVCLISDSFSPWTMEISQRASIAHIEFYTGNAMSHLLAVHLDALFDEGIFPEEGPSDQWKRETPLMLNHIPCLESFPSELFPSIVRFNDFKHSYVQLISRAGASAKSAERLLINTMSELETAAFESYEFQGIPAYAIGPLTMQKTAENHDESGCLPWLDMQAESSVIYVAFGSLYKMSREEVEELAMGLEGSGRPFLWVVREEVPAAFLRRTSRRGMIIKWAPQVKVLAHKAVGGFLSHCGWNSILESMGAGVPLLCWPRCADQRVNCHCVCHQWGAGLELQCNQKGGLERALVKEGVNALLLNEEGRKAKRQAQKAMHLMRRTSRPGGQSFWNLQRFYQDMCTLASHNQLHTAVRK